jgi:hypothetical protein
MPENRVMAYLIQLTRRQPQTVRTLIATIRERSEFVDREDVAEKNPRSEPLSGLGRTLQSHRRPRALFHRAGGGSRPVGNGLAALVGARPDQMPSDGDLIDTLLYYAPDEVVRKKILVENPMR